VLYIPGHSSDHLCLYEAGQGWLFSGDLFVGGQDRALRAGSDIWQIIAGLKRIAALPLRMLFPGSARVRAEPHQAIEDKIAYLQALGEQICASHQQGLAPGKIARAACGPPMWIELLTLGHFSRRQLVNSYLRAGFDSRTP
jgi:glyoxylase-like metal-dependent hydrolase (beta-lactamase superfamily II)